MLDQVKKLNSIEIEFESNEFQFSRTKAGIQLSGKFNLKDPIELGFALGQMINILQNQCFRLPGEMDHLSAAKFSVAVCLGLDTKAELISEAIKESKS